MACAHIMIDVCLCWRTLSSTLPIQLLSSPPPAWLFIPHHSPQSKPVLEHNWEKKVCFWRAQWIQTWYCDRRPALQYVSLWNFIPATLWEQFVEGPFLFQHDVPQCTKQGLKKHGRMSLVEELDWSTQSPESWPHPIWTPLEIASLAFSSDISVWPHKYEWMNGQTFPQKHIYAHQPLY